MIEYLFLLLLFLTIFTAGWFHTFIGFFLIIIAILEVVASFTVGYKDSLKGEDNDEEEKRV